MELETVKYEVSDGIALITLTREARHNAINSVMNHDLPVLWAHYEADDSARVAVFTGSGNKAFCVGADLGDLPGDPDDPNSGTVKAIRWSSLQNDVWKPVIAAVNGYATGGGLHFIADADIVVASESATFFDSHVAVGLVAALEPISLCRRMPIGAVLRMALTGGAERLSAADGFRLGMVDEVVPPKQLLPRALALAGQIKRHSPAAVARTKRAIWEAQNLGLKEALELSYKYIADQTKHPDQNEGVRAFVERREPNWLPYSSLWHDGK